MHKKKKRKQSNASLEKVCKVPKEGWGWRKENLYLPLFQLLPLPTPPHPQYQKPVCFCFKKPLRNILSVYLQENSKFWNILTTDYYAAIR